MVIYLDGWLDGWLDGRHTIIVIILHGHAFNTTHASLIFLPGLPGGFKAVVITSICYYYLYFMNVCMYVLFLFFVVVFLIITGKHCIGIAFAKTKIFTYEENRMDFS